MIDSHYEWQVLADSVTDEEQALATTLNMPTVMIQLLKQRGLTSRTEIEAFLNPSPEEINDPFMLHDMERVIDRINEALMNGEHITIYGDYDTDGITSTAIMYETLMMLDADVDFYVPNRFTDGYGPNKDVYQRLITQGTQLIITVDNGVAGHAAIDFANEQGADVIVTDHHEIPSELPAAYAIIHPQHPASEYPYKYLSGVGVAFKVATALLEEIPQEMMDLVALGEIADLVALTGENRVLVTYGLKMLAQTTRPGLQALMELAGVGLHEVTAEQVAFGITPRLNAIGRLQSAQIGVELLVTQDPERASDLAQQVNQLNDTRKQIVAEIVTQAKEQLAELDLTTQKTIILAGDGWHEGVLGIVASQVVELTHRPTIILTQENNKLKGSARSIDGFDLYQALAPHAELFSAFGGHAGAAGLSLATDNLAALKKAFEHEADVQNVQLGMKAPLTIAKEISVTAVNEQLFAAIQKLAPFGNSNEQPYFKITGNVSDIKQIGADKKHLKFNLMTNESKLAALAFGQGELGDGLLIDKAPVSVVATLSENTWQGQTSLQLMVKDIQQGGLAIIDQRTNKLRPDNFKITGQYVFFNPKVMQQLLPYLNAESTAIAITNGDQLVDNGTTILVDLPKDLSDLTLLQGHQFKELRVIFYTAQHVYLESLPTKADFAKLYKYILGHADLPIRAELPKLAKFLQIGVNQLSLMITVFFELGFVRIESGVLNVLPNPKHADLTTAPSYQAWITKQAIEKSLIYSKTSELTTTLTDLMS
ncbi:single-stranded-DNA-specific exonuclease RecJ [Periweissella fabaria]|uniref:Single-stranded-DNA-specific exonuclease RecJ n=1 Tax=Periweissella fabaria TaxID=546157 RepID=A0ABM8Z6X0_9LACO|nr:single-stranded-DNA-specific exonuclease RecJ [Periweissella fabaria]MCM0597083.1 single-stranded-DNA-specific exonuclease RecJ [Periweissella fabaria]CAH0417133.1 hypothetical protein WFA24289_01450 [Periweissella fabaria]